jgi:hypothetical protein
VARSRGVAESFQHWRGWRSGAWAILVAVPVLAAVLAVAAAGLRETGLRAELAPSSGGFVRAHDVELYVQEAGRR